MSPLITLPSPGPQAPLQGAEPAVFDAYATGDHSRAALAVVNQTQTDQRDLRVRVRVYDVAGRVREDRTSPPVDVASGGTTTALWLPRVATDSPVFFVRVALLDGTGHLVTDSTYWQSQRRDDVGDPGNDRAFELRPARWAGASAF